MGNIKASKCWHNLCGPAMDVINSIKHGPIKVHCEPLHWKITVALFAYRALLSNRVQPLAEQGRPAAEATVVAAVAIAWA